MEESWSYGRQLLSKHMHTTQEKTARTIEHEVSCHRLDKRRQ